VAGVTRGGVRRYYHYLLLGVYMAETAAERGQGGGGEGARGAEGGGSRRYTVVRGRGGRGVKEEGTGPKADTCRRPSWGWL